MTPGTHPRTSAHRALLAALPAAALALALVTAAPASSSPAGAPAESADGTAATSAVKLTKVSEDPYTNPAAYHQTEVESDTFAWGDTIVSVFQTGRFPNGGSTNTGFATSVDGGDSWTHGFMPRTTVYADPPGPYARISDPVIAYDAKHDVWLTHSLIVDTKNILIVNRSVDGGLSWGRPVIVSTPTGSSDYDKNWIVCDNWESSPHYGSCYIEVDDTGFGNLVRMFRSTDGGRSWSEADVPEAHGLGGLPLAQPDGTVIVPFSGNLANVQSLVSKDGGKTYTGPYPVASTTDHAVPFMRAPALPSAEIDGSGRVYVVWQDCRFRDGCATNDIVMSTSKDGKRWREPVRIPLDPRTSEVDHFTPGIGVSRTSGARSGDLALTYWTFPTEDCSLATCDLFAAYSSSRDGGRSWTEPIDVVGPLGLEWLPDAGGRFVGDYLSTSIMNGRAYPVLANARPGDCTVGEIDSCREFMVAPTRGLPIRAGTLPVVDEQPVAGAQSDHALVGAPRAF